MTPSLSEGVAACSGLASPSSFILAHLAHLAHPELGTSTGGLLRVQSYMEHAEAGCTCCNGRRNGERNIRFTRGAMRCGPPKRPACALTFSTFRFPSDARLQRACAAGSSAVILSHPCPHTRATYSSDTFYFVLIDIDVVAADHSLTNSPQATRTRSDDDSTPGSRTARSRAQRYRQVAAVDAVSAQNGFSRSSFPLLPLPRGSFGLDEADCLEDAKGNLPKPMT